MGNLNLVTGHTGVNHVTATDQASVNAAIFGAGEYVLHRGQELSALAISANTVLVYDGDIMMQGRHIRINSGDYIDLTIDSGTVGLKRNDLIVCRYTRNPTAGVEAADIAVIKGTASAGTPSDPSYTAGDILAGNDTTAEMPLYRISLDGITIGTPTRLFAFADTSVPDTRTIAGIGLDANVTVAQLRQALAAYYVGGTDVAVSDGGTGASTAAEARINLGAKAAGIEPISTGGTGANSAAGARENLGITPANIGAKAASNVEDIAHGGTGASDAATARANLGAMPVAGGTFSGAVRFGNNLLLDGSVYGSTLPTQHSSDTVGRIFFKRV